MNIVKQINSYKETQIYMLFDSGEQLCIQSSKKWCSEISDFFSIENIFKILNF